MTGNRLRGVGNPQDLGVSSSGGTFTGPVTFDGAADFNSTANFDGAVTLNSSLNLTPVTITNANSPYSLTTPCVLYCDATSGAITVTLPTIASAGGGRVYIIVKTDSSTNAITINRAGSDTINGLTSSVLPTQYDKVTLVSNSTVSAWYGSDNVSRLRVASTNLSASNIVGTGTGAIGSGGGCPLVEAPSGFSAILAYVTIAYTFATAAYTGGSTISISTGNITLTGSASAANSFGAATNRSILLTPLSTSNALSVTYSALTLTSGGVAFTQPGTAAGTGVVKTYYTLIRN